ncbi:MAG: flagellar motor protein MotB [Oligoflexales bacterium]
MAKKKCPEFENHERWLVSYADMLTLLFAVFVVLFALKDGGGGEETQETAGSMQESFSTPLEDIPIDRKTGSLPNGGSVFEYFQGENVTPPPIQKYDDQKQEKGLIDTEMHKFKTQLENRLYGPHKFRSHDESGNSRLVEIRRSSTGFQLKILARHFYDEGEIDVKKTAIPQVDKVITMLKKLRRTVVIEGHTDNLPTKGRWSNWDVSALRATHLVKYMIEKHKFPQSKLAASGYGDTRPIAHNGTQEGRQLNRRIEIHVHYDRSKHHDPLR